jgi:hypothetical protein
MDTLFNICVAIMVHLGHILGISYQAVNILLFVIIHPLITLALMLRILYLKRKR